MSGAEINRSRIADSAAGCAVAEWDAVHFLAVAVVDGDFAGGGEDHAVGEGAGLVKCVGGFGGSGDRDNMAACAVGPDAFVVGGVDQNFIVVDVEGAWLNLPDRQFRPPVGGEISGGDLEHFGAIFILLG